MTSPDPGAASLGYQDAARLITAEYAGGVPLDQIRAVQDDLSARLINDAQTGPGIEYAREYADTARTLLADLQSDAAAARQEPEPGGTPHPDPRLAARGWQRCADDCGVYVRRQAQASRDMDREAG